MAGSLPGVELGTYYVSVTTSTQKLYRDLNSGAATAGATAGGTAGDAYASAMSKKVSAGLKIGLAGLGGAIAFKGIDRLLAIDDAQHKLIGLGNTTETVAAVMDSALKAVTGTAYGLGDAATIAASAVAAGVKPGKELTDYLSLTADTATIARASLSDMGSIMNKVRTNQVAYTDDLQQLADRGIPIFQYLQKEYGVTAVALRKMVQDGQVDAATFEKVLRDNIGGAALSAGDSIRGSFANLTASLSRIGANLLGGDIDEVPKFFQDLTKTLQPVEQVAKVVGTVLGQVVDITSKIPTPVLAAAAAALVLGKNSERLLTSFRDARFQAIGLAGSLGLVGTKATFTGSALAATSTRLGTLKTTARSAGASLVGVFGGPAGIALTAGSIAITGALSAWTAATEAQKQAVADLTATLDENTGAVTAQTTKSVTDALDTDGTLKKLQEVGVSVDDISAKVLGQASGYGAVKKQLQDIIDTEIAYANSHFDAAGNTSELSDKYFAAQEALDGLEKQYKLAGTASDQFKLKAEANGEVVTDSAKDATKQYTKLGDAVTAAFKKFDKTAAARSALNDLKESIADNGKVLNNTTDKGIANSQAFESALSALATSAGSNSDKFAGSVIGLLKSLRAQGIDTTNVVGLANTALKNLTGTDWTVYLNGSQSVAESLRVAKAALAAAEAQKALADPSNEIRSQIAGLNSLKSAVASTTQAYSAYTPAASSASTATNSATNSVKGLKQAIVSAAKALHDGFDSGEKSDLLSAISKALKGDAIGNKQAAALKKYASAEASQLQALSKSRDKSAKQIDAANQKLSDAVSARDELKQSIIDGFKSLGDITKLASSTQDAVTVYKRVGDTIFGLTQDDTTSKSAQNMIDGLQAQVDAARTFKTTYDQLTKLGLNKDSLQSLLTDFTSSGDASNAVALLAGGKSAVGQVNALESQLNTLGSSLGSSASTSLYQAGVDSAQGFLDGLKSQDGKLKASYEAIADNLVATIKKKLGIHSPSRVMAELAGYTSDGWNDNLSFVDPVVAAGRFNTGTSSAADFELVNGQRVYLQQINHYAYTEPEAERINDGLAMVSAVAGVPSA